MIKINSLLTGVLILTGLIFFSSGCGESGEVTDSLDIIGCTDPDAVNYDPLATTDDGSCEYGNLTDDSLHFVVDIQGTGETQLIVFQAGITLLEPGDEVGIFDLSGRLNFNDCSDQRGELLVGSGVWTGEQLSVVGIGSIDNCSFGGYQYPGYIKTNPVVIRVWDKSEGIEIPVTGVYSVGDGEFGELFLVITELIPTD